MHVRLSNQLHVDASKHSNNLPTAILSCRLVVPCLRCVFIFLILLFMSFLHVANVFSVSLIAAWSVRASKSVIVFIILAVFSLIDVGFVSLFFSVTFSKFGLVCKKLGGDIFDVDGLMVRIFAEKMILINEVIVPRDRPRRILATS